MDVRLAEAVGFEPTKGFPPCSVSNRVLSASQPRLQLRYLIGGRGGGKGKSVTGPVAFAARCRLAWPPV